MADRIAQHLDYLRLPLVAACALDLRPAWLWSGDGDRLLWTNAAGARIFGLASAAAAALHPLKPADPHRRQAVRLARQMTATGVTRLERLRGFGAPFGGLATCACTRLPLGDDVAILVVSGQPATNLTEDDCTRGLIDGVETPAMALTAAGKVVASNAAATDRALTAELLSDPALLFLEGDARENGHSRGSLATGEVEMFRVGNGDATVLITALVPNPACTAAPNVATHASDGASERAASVVAEAVEPVGALRGIVAEPGVVTESPSPKEPDEESQPMSVIEPPAESAKIAADPAALPPARKGPLRFIWQTDAEGRFTLSPGEFAHLTGAQTMAGLDASWNEIASRFALDPHARVAMAMAAKQAINGFAIDWPVDGDAARLPVELSGVPIFDAARQFAGYRGFGLVRDLDALARLDALRHTLGSAAASDVHIAGRRDTEVLPIAADLAHGDDHEMSRDQPMEAREASSVESAPEGPPPNVVPFRPAQSQDHRPTLTAVENSAFNEIARQLSARLDDNGANVDGAPPHPAEETAERAPAPSPAFEENAAAAEAPGWAAPAGPAPRGQSQTDLALFDRLPVGVLIYRLDRLLYANRPFLNQVGYHDLQSLTEAGGLDALFVEPGVSAASSTSDTGTPVRISSERSSSPPADASLHAITWDGEQAMSLIFSGHGAAPAPIVAAVAAPLVSAAAPVPDREAGQLREIIDAVPDAVLTLDGSGQVREGNRAAREMFGIDSAGAWPAALSDLFAPESRTAVVDAVEASRRGAGDRSREVLARRADGSLISLSMAVSRTSGEHPAIAAILRDLTTAKKTEAQLLGAQRQADRAASVKADVLARISHEVRTPLNSIIGFADVMIGERFGALGNDRYADYLRDIRASGERVISIINEMLDLSHIETGKLDLTLASQNLNDLVEQCVGVMQPQANRERIIIRTSLARGLPWVMADARALRQIAMNLIGNSIHLANAGGQVIVSTAQTDFGDVVLRVRDTGQGLNDNEVAAALAPFRAPMSPDDVTPANSGFSLSLTKALVEANGAHFQIRSSPQAGTLIEVRFALTAARASSGQPR